MEANIFRAVFYGLASGYSLKAIQFLVSVVMIPFLISDGVLGIAGYGQVATLLALHALLMAMTDGVRVSQSRTIARSIGTEPESGKIVGSCAQVIGIISFPVSLVALLFPETIAGLAGLSRDPQMTATVQVVAIHYLAENIFSIFVAALHAVRRTYLVNIVTFIEVLLKNGAIVVVFLNTEPTVITYFLIFAGSALLKNLAFVFLARKESPRLFKGLKNARPIYGLTTLIYSFPISGTALLRTLIYRGGVIIVNKFIGPEAAGFLSILVVTITNYVSQLTYGSLHPMMVPLSARIDVRALSDKSRSFIADSFRFYTLGVFAVCFSLSAVGHQVLIVWLGSEYAFLSFPLQGVMASAALGLSAAPKYSFLIAHGYAAQLFRFTLPVGVICFTGIFVSVGWGAPWETVIAFMMISNLFSNGIIIEWIFGKRFPRLCEGGRNVGGFGRPVAAVILAILVWGVSVVSVEVDNALAGMVVGLAFAPVLVALVCHFLIFDVRLASSFALTAFNKIRR